MALLLRRSQLAAKIGTEGTFDPGVIAAAYADLVVFDPKMDLDVQQYERDPVRASIGQLPSIPGIATWNLELEMDVKGSGTAGTPPAWGRMVRACGFGETVETGAAAISSVIASPKNTGTNIAPVASGTYTGTKNGLLRLTLKTITTDTSAVLTATFFPADGTAATVGDVTHTDGAATSYTAVVAGVSIAIANPDTNTTGWRVGDEWFFKLTSDQSVRVVYRPISDGIPCLDVALLEDGRVKKGHSFRGNLTGSFKVGEPGRFGFKMMGVRVTGGEAPTVEDQAILTGIDFETTVPVAFINVGPEFFGEELCFSEFSFDMGNELAKLLCANAESGVDAVNITNRAPTGSVDPLAQLPSVFDPFTAMLEGLSAGQEITFTVGLADGNIVTFTAFNVQITQVASGDREGNLTDQLTLRFNEPEFSETGDYYELEIAVE